MKTNIENNDFPEKIVLKIVKNLKNTRKRLNISQIALSEKSGVSLGSIKRFEREGAISLTSLIKIAIVLDCIDDFENLFNKTIYNSINEIIGR